MAWPRPPQRKRPLSGWIVFALILVIGVGWVFGSTWVIRWFDAPWSIAALGPTLTGTWEGPLQARQGAQYRLSVTLDYEEAGRHSSTNVRGTGRICNRYGQTFELLLRGRVNRDGDRFKLTLPKADDAQDGPSLTLDGHWSGDELTVKPTANPFLADGTFQAVRTISTNDPDDSFIPSALRRADHATFEAACRELRA
jgi:hypothetical protein